MRKSILVLLGLLYGTLLWAAEASQLSNIALRSSQKNKLQLVLEFSGAVVSPKSFSVEVPPTLVFDFPGVKSNISKEVLNQLVSGNLVKNINVAESEDKTRIAIDVQRVVPFTTEVNGKTLVVTFEENTGSGSIARGGVVLGDTYEIKSFDFHRGTQGEARLIFDLSNSKATVNFKEEQGDIIIEFIGATLKNDLAKRYNVVDFATPVQSVSIESKGQNVEMIIQASGDFNKIAYQMDNQFILEVRGINQNEKIAQQAAAPKYTGEKISLNFQNIDIRAVLQIIADFSGFNIITNDTVKGNITLRLQDVPWDQALDIILKSKGLDKRQSGTVMLVGPAAQIAAAEKTQLESLKQVEDLGPMKSELIQVNYADADTLSKLLKDKASSALTSRGTVAVDKRTNTLLIQDVESRLGDIRALLKKLDRPVRQVEISTQIVTATSQLEKVLGFRLGGGGNAGIGRRRLGIGSTMDRARAIADAGGSNMVPSAPDIGSEVYNAAADLKFNDTEGLFADLSAAPAIAASPRATIGLAFARLPGGTLLDLELQALEYETQSKTLARPKLITEDQSQASVEQGVQIPYQQASSSGATTTAFKDAALKLEVTPQISPDDKITMDLSISKDTVGDIVPGSPPQINTNRITTKVMVDNGETVVLGGILQVLDSKKVAKVPFLGDLPIIGGLFRNKYYQHSPQELIIFLTPKILEPINRDDMTR